MKKVVALKNYTDPYYIFREGMIYNLEDSVANKFVALGTMTEGTPDDVVITSASTSGTQIADIKINGQSNKIYAPASGGGGGVLVVGVTVTTGLNSGEIYTLDKTWQEIHDAYMSGSLVYILLNTDGEYLQCDMVVQVSKYTKNEENPYYGLLTAALSGNEFGCASPSGYPQYISN